MIEVYSDDGEIFEHDIGDVIDNITSNNCETYEDALESHVYVGDMVVPEINTNFLVEHIEQYMDECLHEQAGEFSDGHQIRHTKELKEFLDGWLSKQLYNFYSVKNIKEVSILEYITKEELKEIYE